MKTTIAALAGGLLWTSVALPAWAQDYPDETITMYVGYTAGGQADAVARTLGDALSERLGQTVVVENKPGANGLLAAQEVAQAEPDGYSILFVTDAQVTIEPQLAESQQWDARGNLTPVIQLADGPLYVAVNASSEATTLAEFLDAAKAGGETVTFGTSGTATPHRMAGEALATASGVAMTNVAYQGTSDAVTDLAGGNIDMVIGASTSIQPLIDAGQVKLLATVAPEPTSLQPDVPAAAEAYPGIDFGTYFGVMVPNGTPEDVVATLNASFNEILADPAMAEQYTQLGVIPTGGTPDEFRARIDADYEARGAILEQLGLRAAP